LLERNGIALRETGVPRHAPLVAKAGPIEELPLNLFFFLVAALLYTPVLVLYLSHRADTFTLTSLVSPALYCLGALLIPIILSQRWRRRVEVFDLLMLAPAVYVLVAATFFPVPGEVLDGTARSVGKAERLSHDGLMVLCLGAAIVSISHVPLRNALRRFASLFGVFAVVSTIYMALSVLPAHADTQDRSRYTAALSPKQNVVVVLLDMLQGSFGAEYFRRNPAIENDFDGFAFYRNVASFAPFTALSYSGFMSGGYPRGEQVQEGGVHDSIYYKENIIDDMAASGYAARYFSVITYQNDNQKVIKIPDDIGLGRKHDFVLFALAVRGRYLPYSYLPFGNKLMPWTQLEVGSFKADARDSLRWFTNNVEVDPRMDKGFLWFHSLMAHQPIRFDASGRYSVDLGPNDVNGEVSYTFGMLREFLTRLKKLGVYDNSLLIVLADHGYNIMQDMKTLPIGAEYARRPFGEGVSVGQYNPLLMVKRPGAHGKLTYNDTAITLLDLRKTLKEYVSPGSGATLNGFNFLGPEKGGRSRTVPVIKFVGSRFDPSKDFTDLTNWRPDTLRLPFDANYGHVERPPDPAVVHAQASDRQ
jgi:hypothetical protein